MDTPRRTNRSSVSPLTGRARRRARRPPAAPPSAIPMCRWISASRRLRRECAVATSESRSTKILRPHGLLPQRKRRTVTTIATARPCHGRSASLRSYRLWMRRERRRHAGQDADVSRGSALIVIRSASVRIWFTTNSAGTSASRDSKLDDPVVSHLSPRFGGQVQPSPAPKVRKSPFWMPIRGPFWALTHI